ncbi:MAG TPA: tetratricopeptide repeat protein [Gemmatimonadales bacterium]|nr:tetratricopeptide repeat protein [Gemmatimonadales bacterium]
MSESFLNSEDLAEQAHQLYNEGRYDDAIALLRTGLESFPYATELHVGLAYAYLAREDFGWARRAFDTALTLNPEHEDALVGMGEVLLKLGRGGEALACFEKMLVLGFRDDHDLVLQAGRALFREGAVPAAGRFFRVAVEAHPESSEAKACLGYAEHRLGNDAEAIRWLRTALELDPSHVEARIYLGNLLYDRAEFESALYHFDQTMPDDHVDELAVWRLIELKKSIYRLEADDPELRPWVERLAELAELGDEIDRLLAEVEATQPDGTVRDPLQLELFGTLLLELDGMRRRGSQAGHRVTTRAGASYGGTWEEIVAQMQADDPGGRAASLTEYMESVARRRAAEGIVLPATDAEAFVLASAAAGLLKIIR